MAGRLEIHDVVRQKAIAAGSASWLDALPSIVQSLERDWQIEVGATMTGGTEAFVAEATRDDGTAAVLKVLVPRSADHDLAGAHSAAAAELTVLGLAGGDGCARLYRGDAARGAMLLERLGPSMADLDIPVRERHEIMVGCARQMWRPAPGLDLPTGATKGRWLIEHIERMWSALDHPCPRPTVDHAVACAERRVSAHRDDRALLLHGDIHQWNTLLADAGLANAGLADAGLANAGLADAGLADARLADARLADVGQADHEWKLVDPDGLLAEPEYDLGILMREDPDEIWVDGPWERAERLASMSGCDPVATFEWGVVERVSTAMVCIQIGLAEGDRMLDTANRIAEIER